MVKKQTVKKQTIKKQTVTAKQTAVTKKNKNYRMSKEYFTNANNY